MEILYRIFFSITGVVIASFLIQLVLRIVFRASEYSRPLARILGLTIAVLGTFIALNSYTEFHDIPVDPDPISIPKVSPALADKDHLWVRIPDGTWDCSNLGYDEYNTFAFLSSQEATSVIVVTFNEKMTCQDLQGLQPSGRLAKLARRRSAYLSSYVDFSKYGPRARFFSLCAYCGRQNSKTGMVAGIVFAVLGLLYDKIMATSPGHATHTTTPRLPPQDSMS